MRLHVLRLVVVPAFVLAAAGACSGDGADRTVSVGARDYTFSGMDSFTGKAGERVEFALTNAGAADHEFEVFDADGKAVGEVGPTSEGKTRKVTLTLAKPGTYRFVCGVSDHEARGMTGTFTVT
jgi:iron uptake system component EfeO